MKDSSYLFKGATPVVCENCGNYIVPVDGQCPKCEANIDSK